MATALRRPGSTLSRDGLGLIKLLDVNQRRYRIQGESGYSTYYGDDQRRNPPLTYIGDAINTMTDFCATYPSDQKSPEYRSGRETQATVGIVGLCIIYTALLLTNFTLDFSAAEPLGLLFNDMAVRMLHWDFTISPSIVREEAFLRDGDTYTYFGIFPALLRLPAIAVGIPNLSLSRLSCWTALSISAMAQASILLALYRASRVDALYLLVIGLLAVLLTGPQLQLTFSSYVYNEPITWGGAFIMLYIHSAIGPFLAASARSNGGWIWLGVLTGLAFLSRATDGLAIGVGVAVLVLLEPTTRGLPRVICMTRMALLSGSGMLVFVLAGLLVNAYRWGNPFEFMPERLASQFLASPHRMAVLLEYGDFNLLHVPLTIIYYFFGAFGPKFIYSAYDKFADGVSYPRSLLILTSSVTLLLTVIGFRTWASSIVRCTALPRKISIAVTAPIITAFVLIFSILLLSYMNYRYRYAFQPLFCVGTASGLYVVSGMALSKRRKLTWILGLVLAFNVAVSHLDLLQSKFSSFAVSPADKTRLINLTWPMPRLFNVERTE